MKNISIYIVLFATVSFMTSCGSNETATGEEAKEEQTANKVEQDEEGAEVEMNDAGGYGAVISTESAMSVAQLVSSLESQDSVMATVKGEVTSACQMSGCWMKMPYGESDEMMVKFKDYGFFVPKDLNGQVVIAGKAKKEVVSVEMLRHYAEDAGKSAEEIAQITEPVLEVSFLADGVMPVEGE
ncbi:MAG: hypothetical protein ACI959_000623 [Limisphaerales bacterium]|jgi:hypothetical protein